MVKDVVNFSLAELNNLLNDSNSCVEVVSNVLNIALYPYQLNDFKLSLKAVLNRKIGKYDKKLCGILLSYKNVKVLSELGAIIEDSCFIHIDVKADFYIFKPMVDSTLVGIVNKRSNDHIGCLVHKVFNVSIPKPNNSSDWDTSNIRNGQEILLNISHVDLHATLPYIRAKLLSVLSKPKEMNEQYEPNKKTKKKRHSDAFESTVEQIDQSTEVVTEKKKKKKDKNMDESEISHELNNGMPDESVAKKKKHKKNHTDLEYSQENAHMEHRKNSINAEEKPTKKKRKSNNSLDENCELENSLNDSSKWKTKSKKDNSLDIQTEIKSKKRKHSTTESISEYESSPKKKKKDESDLSQPKKKSKKNHNTL